MTWIRNLAFIAVCLGGAALLSGFLLKPDRLPEPEVRLDPGSFTPVIERVDAEFAARWKQEQIEPAPLSTDLQVARRLSLGLTGTIPSLQELRALEQQAEGERIDWWLAHLFGDPRYANYTAERFARAFVGVEGGPFLVYRRRRFVDWLSKRLLENQAYDGIARNLITARGTWTNEPETNFITVTIDPNDKKGPDEVKLAARLTRAFLGVRLDCVQCHNDFLHDTWKQRDFHQLAAFFTPVKNGVTGISDDDSEYQYLFSHAKGEETVPPVVPWKPELLPAEEQGELRDRLAAWVTHPDNRPFARAAVNRVWALMFGRPLIAPVDEIPLEGPYPPGLEILADDFIAHGYDLQRLISIIAHTRAFRTDSRLEEGHPSVYQEEHWAAWKLNRLRSEQVAGSVLQAASLDTIDAQSHILVRLMRFSQQGDFIKRYGDMGEDEFTGDGGTIPQRLVMMNGELVDERTKENLAFNAATRLAVLTKKNDVAIESAYLAVLTRRPSAEETAYFEQRLEGTKGKVRQAVLQDMYWGLINSTEFSWGH